MVVTVKKEMSIYVMSCILCKNLGCLGYNIQFWKVKTTAVINMAFHTIFCVKSNSLIVYCIIILKLKRCIYIY